MADPDVLRRIIGYDHAAVGGDFAARMAAAQSSDPAVRSKMMYDAALAETQRRREAGVYAATEAPQERPNPLGDPRMTAANPSYNEADQASRMPADPVDPIIPRASDRGVPLYGQRGAMANLTPPPRAQPVEPGFTPLSDPEAWKNSAAGKMLGIGQPETPQPRREVGFEGLPDAVDPRARIGDGSLPIMPNTTPAATGQPLPPGAANAAPVPMAGLGGQTSNGGTGQGSAASGAVPFNPRGPEAFDPETGTRDDQTRKLSLASRIFGEPDSDKRKSMSKALMMAGAAIMSSPGDLGQAIGAGIQAGVTTFDEATQALRDEEKEMRQMGMEEEAHQLNMALKRLQLERRQGGGGGVGKAKVDPLDAAASDALVLESMGMSPEEAMARSLYKAGYRGVETFSEDAF